MILFQRNFEKQLRKLPREIRGRFDERLHLFVRNKFDPLLNNHSVDYLFLGCRSLNITGDYRAIFYEHGEIITFVAIGSHSQLYG